jgi:hypothetical protein
MLRLIGGVIAALLVWTAAAILLNFGLRYGLPGYAAVEKAMTFTVPMMAARLGISFIATLACGYTAAAVGKRQSAALIVGVILLLLFIPVHYGLWHKFPIWYHLTFLISLPVLSVIGGRFARTA